MGDLWRRVRRQTSRLRLRRRETDTADQQPKRSTKNSSQVAQFNREQHGGKVPRGDESHCSEVGLKNDEWRFAKWFPVHNKTGVWDSFTAMLLLFTWLRMRHGQFMNQAPLEYQLEAWVRIPPEPFGVVWVGFSSVWDVQLVWFWFGFGFF